MYFHFRNYQYKNYKFHIYWRSKSHLTYTVRINRILYYVISVGYCRIVHSEIYTFFNIRLSRPIGSNDKTEFLEKKSKKEETVFHYLIHQFIVNYNLIELSVTYLYLILWFSTLKINRYLHLRYHKYKNFEYVHLPKQINI